jgi:hypothetical protein
MKGLWWWVVQRISPGIRRHVLGMALVLAASLALRLDHVALSLPYCRHTDERTWVNIAFRMLQTRSANPKRFNKPSVPVYLMTAGFAVGVLAARITGDARSVKDLGHDVETNYRVPGAALPPKALYAFASVVALGAAGYVGFRVTRRAAMLWLVPLLGAISSWYFELSWLYMNVDILGTAFLWTTLAYLIHHHTQGNSFAQGSGWLRRLLALGLLSGLTVGCKYNLYPVLLPGALWFVLFDRRRWFLHASLLCLIAVVTFFVTTPYALVTPHEFLGALSAEANHYATGHTGRPLIAKGLPMLWLYVQDLVENFGWIPYLLSLAGAALLVRRDPRVAALLFAYPVAFTAYMSMQRVFFARNAVSLHPFVALTLAFAILELPGWLAAAAVSFRPGLASRWLPRVVAVFVVVALVAGIPWSGVALAYSRRVEPRNDAVRWLARKGKKDGLLVVDKSLKLDHRRIDSRMRVLELDPKREAGALGSTLDAEPHLTVVTHDANLARFEEPGPDLVTKARYRRAGSSRGIVILER